MPAQRFDFVKSSSDSYYCEQGATFFYELIWEKEDPPGSDLYIPVDITGYAAKMQIRKSAGSPIIIELSTQNGRIALTSLEGKIALSISATDTDALSAGVYKYDLELTDSNGFVTRFIEGKFEVVGEITI